MRAIALAIFLGLTDIAITLDPGHARPPDSLIIFLGVLYCVFFGCLVAGK